MTSNQVISRLQQQRSRIRSMLNPGLKRKPGDISSASLSPVAVDFAGRKFQLAAKKMRILDAGKLRQSLPGVASSLSTDIISKFRDVQKMIHVKHPASQETRLWDPVETTLTDGKAPSQETPAEPGMLRQGSVIQKMSVTPKPGQSLESFKQQIQSQPARSKFVPASKKTGIEPKTRLFSRVQEVTPGQKPDFQEAPGLPAVPVQPVEAEKNTSEAVQVAPSEPSIQAQPDLNKTATETAIPETKTLPKPEVKTPRPEMTLREVSQIPQEVKSVDKKESTVPVEGKSSELPLEPPEQKMISPEQPVETKDQAILSAIPIKKELPTQIEDQPLPVLKKAQPVIRKVKEQVKPVARPTIQSTSKKSAAIARPAIQRQVDMPDSALRPPLQGTPEEVSPSAPQPVPPVVDELKASKTILLEGPLQQHMDYRKQATRIVRKLEPEKLKQVPKDSLIHHLDTPLLSSAKYVKKQETSFRPADQHTTPVKTGLPVSVPGGPQTLRLDLPGRQASKTSTQESLPLATPQAAQTAPSGLSKATLPVEMPLPPARTSTQPKAPGMTGISNKSNTIQRTWEEHKGVEMSQSNNQSKDMGRSRPELEILAEDVFPYVKRILENEANRSSSNLR